MGDKNARLSVEANCIIRLKSIQPSGLIVHVQQSNPITYVMFIVYINLPLKNVRFLGYCEKTLDHRR